MITNNNSSKPCYFCQTKTSTVDYKNIQLLRRFMSPHAKILSRERTGTCAAHQHRVAKALKRARHMALLPFVSP
jgi:small subunit ribosomal protein S18